MIMGFWNTNEPNQHDSHQSVTALVSFTLKNEKIHTDLKLCAFFTLIFICESW